MIYYLDYKQLDKYAEDSVIIIHNEQKFFAWLCKTLKPEYAYFLELARCGREYNAESDEQRSWYDYSELEQEYLYDVMRSYIDDERAVFVLDAHDSSGNLLKWYNFGVDRHVARFASDIPANFENENEESGITAHAWKNEKQRWASFDLFERIIDDCDYEITVFTL